MYHQKTEHGIRSSPEPFDCHWLEQSFRPCKGLGERTKIRPVIEGQEYASALLTNGVITSVAHWVAVRVNGELDWALISFRKGPMYVG